MHTSSYALMFAVIKSYILDMILPLKTSGIIIGNQMHDKLNIIIFTDYIQA